MSEFRPDNVVCYGKLLSSLTKDELIKVVLKVTEIIHNCPAKGKCNGILEIKDQETAKK
jgi:hypothetical protein